MTTSARPCDSPAVRKRSIRPRSYTKFLRTSRNTSRHAPSIPEEFRAVSILQSGADTRMPLIAERFLMDDEGAVDLATGESIRLSIDRAAVCGRDRVSVCDRLFGLRHPLLLPLVDYGAFGEHWFEAHANLPALRVPGTHARSCALHLVRFLRSAGMELDAGTTTRNVRPAIDGPTSKWRPIGISLQPRTALAAIRTVLEANGPPGVTAIAVHAAPGIGLRTARVQLARMARQAGYVVIDSRFGALEEVLTPPRHLCVLDWLAESAPLPSALAFADAAGARRHAWIRFCRSPATGAGAIGLEPLMTRDLTNAIYVDAELGPSAGEVRCAIAAAGGNVRALIDALSWTKRGGQAGWVHETAPEYIVRPRAATAIPAPAPAGITRLRRAVDAATALARRGRHARAARVLLRCSEALAARGEMHAASSASTDLGYLLIDRGRLADAADAFQRARTWCPDGPRAARALVGTARVLMEQGRLLDAEGAFRTATLCGDEEQTRGARCGLAEVLVLRGHLDAAEEALADGDAAILATIHRLRGNLAEAARAAARAISTAVADDPRSVCEAHLAACQVQALLGDVDNVRRHAAAAQRAARQTRSPAMRLRAAAEVYGCLERSGAQVSSLTRERLLRASRRLPALSGACIRSALNGATATDEALIVLPRDNAHLIQQFRALLHAIHDAPDEETALQLIAADLLRVLDACSVVVRSASLARQVASAGRSWTEEEALTRPILDGSGPIVREGLTPDVAEPVTVGSAILGAIAVRWIPGTRPPLARARDLIRTAAAAAAPALKALNLPRVSGSEGGVSYPDELLGRGHAAERVRDAIRRAALAPFPVLIEGESGSGKELVARSIHARSGRRARKFCAVNCAALSDDLLEAELFGYARGAFTGAVGERPGLFEEADQGTIFLDEAGELTARAQAKLLRVLQEGEIRRVGENLPRKVDARVVAATNRRLEDEVNAGRFRADLRFRLDVIRISLPPLRERAEDVPWLAQRIWTETSARVGTRATLGDDVLAALSRYDWPGNVRELQNVIASLAVHGPRRGRIPLSVLPVHIARGAEATPGFDEARLDFERRFVRAALARAGGRRSMAASQLGVSRQGLTKIIKRLGLQG